MAQQGEGALLQHPLQATVGAGIGLAGEVAQVALQLPGRRQQAHLQLGHGHRAIHLGPIQITTAHPCGQSRTAAATQGIHQQTHHRH